MGPGAAAMACAAEGFPLFQLNSIGRVSTTSPASRYRGVVHVEGWISSLPNWREGTL